MIIIVENNCVWAAKSVWGWPTPRSPMPVFCLPLTDGGEGGTRCGQSLGSSMVTLALLVRLQRPRTVVFLSIVGAPSS